MKALVGIALVAAQAIGFVALERRERTDAFVVDITGTALASPKLDIHATAPARAAVATDGTAPGLVRRTWTTAYRGGYERSVGVAQLVGPFQDPAAHACVGRVVVGQQLLDDGKASPGTIAHAIGEQVDAEMSGTHITGIGDYRRATNLHLQWAKRAAHPEDIFLVAAADAYLRLTVTLVFDRVEVPLVLVMVPKPTATSLAFRIAARATLDFDNRVLQFISDKVGGDKFATRFARREIDGAVISALAPPPPVVLEDPGHPPTTLTFTFCNGPIEIVDGNYGALPFGIELGRVTGQPLVLPPHRAPGPRAPVPADTTVALDLDLDAMNAMLYELWRSQFLDHRLAAAGLDRRFAADPIVQEYLSLRISSPVLALPPTLAPTPAGALRLATDARITIADGNHAATGRTWFTTDLALAAGTPHATISNLALSCEQTPTRLAPCYSDLVTAVRDRTSDFDTELTAIFSALLTDVFTDRRLGDDTVPASLAISRAHPSLVTSPDATTATIRLALDASVAAP